jgi:hypothetical protein
MTLYSIPGATPELVKTGRPFRGADGTKYPANWLDYPDNVAALGATVVPEPAPPPKSPEQIQAGFSAAIQERLDAFARTRLYDGILSACTYVSSTNPQFAAEGAYCLAARDATWAAGYAILGDVLSGARPMPTIEEVFAELPALTWPEEE